ncbi:TetR/AcrR family transcriptional regulator [Halobacillus sp. A5]|uniref:TetR/AcrR family transcriptional regulator n=1 Tax=Halobacillus sp. A5 TaxID=2880263 RepID=UPI0020A6BE2C|nr:TetR/AcrR family transcriptional regulator [Halobacillus sp. A5]MCP3025921.1 TetR/AcrR family transcriptional regulator [Halobacillus sp. A5]
MGRKKSLTKNELFKAAGELIRSEGIHGVHFKKLAEILGVGRSTLYEYYRNKEELLIAYLKDIMDEMNHRIGNIPGNLQPNEKLRALLYILLDHAEIHQVERMIRDIQTSDADLASYYQTQLFEEHQRTYSILLKWINEAKHTGLWSCEVDSEMIADVIFHAILFPHKHKIGSKSMTDQLMKLIESGASNK